MGLGPCSAGNGGGQGGEALHRSRHIAASPRAPFGGGGGGGAPTPKIWRNSAKRNSSHTWRCWSIKKRTPASACSTPLQQGGGGQPGHLALISPISLGGAGTTRFGRQKTGKSSSWGGGGGRVSTSPTAYPPDNPSGWARVGESPSPVPARTVAGKPRAARKLREHQTPAIDHRAR